MKLKHKVFGAVLLSLIIAIPVGKFALGYVEMEASLHYTKSLVDKLQVEKERVVSETQKLIAEAEVNFKKNDLLMELKACESSSAHESDAIMILDSNNEMSIGEFMFQRDTVVHYYKVLYDKEITRRDAVIISITHEDSRKLAEDILFKTKNGWENWYNCGKKLKLEKRIAEIKNMQ